MKTQIEQLWEQATHTVIPREGDYSSVSAENIQRFANLIVAKCADSADMAYQARCAYPGDYVVEMMGLGENEGAVAWRIAVENSCN